MNTKLEIPEGVCQCGCGNPTPISQTTDARWGCTKGLPRKFIRGHNMRTRGHHKLYSEGKFMHKSGYVWMRCDSHPRQHNGYVLEHILVAEEKLGRFLNPEERVHHENEIKNDNRPENLIVFPNEKAHQQHHVRMAALKACGNPDWRACKFCHNYDALEHLMVAKSGTYHLECKRIHERAYKLTRRN